MVVYALSCRSAKVLGAQSVQQGAHAYIGYNEYFIFLFSLEKRTRPLQDKTGGLFLEPSNQIPLSLLKGHTVHESYTSYKIAFEGNIQRLLTSQTVQADTAVVRYLWWNMQNLTYHGNPKAMS